MSKASEGYAPRAGRLGVIALAAILAVALGLRVQGLGFGLPAVYNPDEMAIMSRALGFATGNLNPHNFLYPTFYFYVLFAWIGAYFAAAWAFGSVASAAAFQTQFFVDPSGIYLAGRTLTVVCGVATVWATFALARRLFDTPTGLVAALFVAIAPTAVRDAHYVKHDVPATLAILVAYAGIVALAFGTGIGGSPRPVASRTRAAALAGALCGLACSTHYYAVFLALPLLLAIHLARRARPLSTEPVAPDRSRPDRLTLAIGDQGPLWRDVLVAGAAAGAVFFALSPFLLVEPRTAWQDVVANRQIVMDRAVEGGQGLFASAGAYLRLLWTEAVGWPVVVAAVAGAGLLARARPAVALLILAFPLPFLAFIANTVAAGRYLNPVIPFVALLAAHAVVRATAGLRGAWPATAPIAMLATAVLLAAPGLLLSMRIGRLFQQTDTRTLAQRYIEAQVAPGATILVQPYSVQLTQSLEGLREALTVRLGDPRRASTKFALRLALDPYPAPAYRTLYLGDGGLDADKIYIGLREIEGSRRADGPETPRRAVRRPETVQCRGADDRTASSVAGARRPARWRPFRHTGPRSTLEPGRGSRRSCTTRTRRTIGPSHVPGPAWSSGRSGPDRRLGLLNRETQC